MIDAILWKTCMECDIRDETVQMYLKQDSNRLVGYFHKDCYTSLPQAAQDFWRGRECQVCDVRVVWDRHTGWICPLIGVNHD